MCDEFKEFDVTPTLTFGVEEEKPAPKEPEKPTDPNMTEDVLSVEERQMVVDFLKSNSCGNSSCGKLFRHAASLEAERFKPLLAGVRAVDNANSHFFD